MQNQQLSDVKGKELVAAGHAFAKAIGMDTPLIEIAKMVSVLATRLDCALVRGDAHKQDVITWEKAMMAAIGEDGVGSVGKAIAELKAQRDALAAENAYLLPKAASELSNAWVLHKYWVGIHVALMHMKVGRIYDAEQWLQNTIAGPGIEAPSLKLTEEIDAWANEQSKDSISHLRALEIIKAENPATDAYLNSVRADAVASFAHQQRVIADATPEHGCQRGRRFAAGLAEDFAAQLRAGKDGE